MPSTTTWRKGDFVLVPVGFTDQAGAKLRPAVIVSSDRYNAQSPDVMIASVAGDLNAIGHPGDHRLLHWEAAGLLRPSLLQAKIAMVELSMLQRRLGRLVREDLDALDRGLREALDLWEPHRAGNEARGRHRHPLPAVRHRWVALPGGRGGAGCRLLAAGSWLLGETGARRPYR